jgi:hypothetical protein
VGVILGRHPGTRMGQSGTCVGQSGSRTGLPGSRVGLPGTRVGLPGSRMGRQGQAPRVRRHVTSFPDKRFWARAKSQENQFLGL